MLTFALVVLQYAALCNDIRVLHVLPVSAFARITYTRCALT